MEKNLLTTSETPRLKRRGFLKRARKGIASPLPLHRLHPRHKWRGILREFHKKDSIHYTKIHSFCQRKLKNRNPSEGLSIEVFNQDDDITDLFSKHLAERKSAIQNIIEKCEFKYIFDGILQHSAHEYTQRYLKDYITGELNYIFMKHGMIVGKIKDLLEYHYKIINVINFPECGPL